MNDDERARVLAIATLYGVRSCSEVVALLPHWRAYAAANAEDARWRCEVAETRIEEARRIKREGVSVTTSIDWILSAE